MSEMIERVAKAMFLRCNPGRNPDFVLSGNTEPDWTAFRDNARCAIEAMLIPTRLMKIAGYKHIPGDGPDPLDDAQWVWTAMVEAALTQER